MFTGLQVDHEVFKPDAQHAEKRLYAMRISRERVAVKLQEDILSCWRRSSGSGRSNRMTFRKLDDIDHVHGKF